MNYLKSSIFFTILSFAFIFPQVVAPNPSPSLTQFNPISNLKNPKLVAIANFGVNELIKNLNENMELVELLDAYYKIEPKLRYKLVVAVRSSKCDCIQVFELIVTKSLDGSMTLSYYNKEEFSDKCCHGKGWFVFPRKSRSQRGGGSIAQADGRLL